MKASILLIEDDGTFSATLSRALRRRGHVVSVAATPETALNAAGTQAPDWIILDLNLGGVSGLSLIAPLRACLPKACIVVLTGYASISTAVDAIKLGATQYLAKPVDVDTLLHTFRQASAEVPVPATSLSPPAVPMSVDRMEWEHLQRVMREHQGNISATARALNMHRRTLQRKLARLPAKK